MNGSGGSVATAPPPSSHPTFLGLKKEEQGKGKDGESQNLGKPVPTNLDEFSTPPPLLLPPIEKYVTNFSEIQDQSFPLFKYKKPATICLDRK